MKNSNKESSGPAPIALLDEEGPADGPVACVMVFNANDPSGAAGVVADCMAMASVGVHPMPVTTGVYARDTRSIADHFALDDDMVLAQARTILEDVAPEVFKVGFVGSADNLGAIASLVSDYAHVPVITYMPELSWWHEDQIELYLDACAELLLPQTTVLVGNYGTLVRWLLPDWNTGAPPLPRDIAQAAQDLGVPYTLITGMALPEQHIDNVLCSASAVLCSEKFERLEATFVGAGDTLSAALAALVAVGSELSEAVTEALTYLDRSLESGLRPGMGHVQPDRLFWAHADTDSDEDDAALDPDQPFLFDLPPNETRH